MTLTKTATTLLLAIAACAPHGNRYEAAGENYTEVSYPMPAQFAVADGHVHEYH